MPRVRTHTNPFNLHKRLEKIDLFKIFPKFSGKIDLEIGFGRGVFLRNYANENPNKFIIGVEVRKQIVNILQKRLTKEASTNVYLVHSSATILLEDIIKESSIETVFIFHPDPWFKKRHHKRRVINTSLLSLLEKKLTPNGKIYLSTDIKELDDDMSNIFKKHPKFKKLSSPDFWNNTYKTHWNIFSIKDDRKEFFLSYERH